MILVIIPGHRKIAELLWLQSDERFGSLLVIAGRITALVRKVFPVVERQTA